MAGTYGCPKNRFLLLGMMVFAGLPPGNAMGQGVATPSATARIALSEPAYAVPPDAQILDGDFSDGNIRVRGQIKIHDLARMNAPDVTKGGWLLWGLSFEAPAAAPEKVVAITNDAAQRLGFNTEYAKQSRGEDFTWIMETPNSAVGPVQIQTVLGSAVTLPEAPLFATQQLDENFKDDNKTRSGEDRVVGILPYTMLDQSLVSLDYRNQKIYFRPLNASRRTFFDRQPVFEAGYQGKYDVYLPVVLNGKISGYALVSTQHPTSQINTQEKDLSDGPVTSYAVNGFDLMKYDPGVKPEVDPLDSYFKGFVFPPGVKVISVLGNDFLKDFFVTIDPLKSKVYFEKPE